MRPSRRLGPKTPVFEPFSRYDQFMNKNTFAALVLVLAVPAGAQEYRQQQAKAAEDAYIALQTQARQMHDSAAKYVAPRVLDATIDAMNDGPEASGRVMRLLQEKKIDVYLAAQAEPAARGVVNGRSSILLSDALPPHPRVYAALIAAEAAKEMYGDMPACAERSYMRMATAARVFAELGGDFKALPDVDGDRVDEVKAAVGAWSGGAESALESTGLPTIPDLRANAADPAAAAALDAANVRFTSFLMDERDARREALQR
jgi:hypothetical protein